MLTDMEKAQIAATGERLRRAILTLDDRSVSDGPKEGHAWPEIVREINKMDHAAELTARRFEPSPQDIDLMLPTWDWLTWLKNRPLKGERWFRIIVSRAYGVPWWKLAMFSGRSEKTMQRRYEEAVIKVWSQFGRYDRQIVKAVAESQADNYSADCLGGG